MYHKVLIANRGEIAVRVIRACREMGLRTVAIYSEVDESSLHVRMADEAVCVGPAESAKSYLSIPAIISAAEITGADAIHPGYGFLAENVHFAEVCESCRIAFIGPSSRAMRLMGDKSAARDMVRRAGMPLIPGSKALIQTEADGLEIVRAIGLPVMIKASAGGGGKGMRLVHHEEEFGTLFLQARTEAQAAFGVPDIYVEKYLEEPRHIEFQILADSHGNAVHLGERDCSIQRRHQKLIEESPSTVVTPRLRREMGRTAVRIAERVGYTGAGTVEFLVDRKGSYYFMEMNTRIQVEHSVTEMQCGIDLVKEQIRIAAGARLRYDPRLQPSQGHTIECRINAEDPERFTPCPGTIAEYHAPGGPGIRIDSAAYAGWKVLPHYDSLVAKLLAHGTTREEAILRMLRALEEYRIVGIKTTIPLHLRVLRDLEFIQGRFSTQFLDVFLRA